MTRFAILLAATAVVAAAAPAAAQEGNTSEKRTRILAGAQWVPQYPGADDHQIQPLLGLSRAKAGEDFDFAAADQSFGFALIDGDKFTVGPVLNFIGKRSRSDTNGLLPKVPFTFEAGGFAQLELNSFRLRGEARRGIGGHDGLIGTASADFVARDGDNWLFAIGPRVTWSNGRYQREYFGVPAGTPGLAAYRPNGGLQAYGGGASALYAFTDKIGIMLYGKYDRLVHGPGRSPVVRSALGDRNQWSGGAGLTYTF